MTLNRILNCASFRMFECVMTFAIIALGVWLAIWPGSIADSAFKAILVVVPIVPLTILYLFVGLSRLTALYINGHSFVVGPMVRAIGALCSAGILFQMDVALIKLHFDTGHDPSPGIPIFTALVCGEIMSTYRAAADVRTPPRSR